MMPSRIALVVVGLAIVVAPSVATAQNGLFSQREQNEDAFMLAPRPLVRLLREGERAIAEGRFVDGVTALGALFQDDAEELPEDLRGQDFFLEQTSRGLYDKTVRGEALSLLANLPEEGRKVLEIKFGGDAARELSVSIAARDFSAMADVARKFPHTDAAYDAQILIARQKLTSGFPLAAASVYQNLLDYPAARTRYGVGLAKAAAIAWMHAGVEDSAARTLTMAASNFAGASLEFDGRQYALDGETDWKSVLASSWQFERSSGLERAANSWLTAGGSPTRSAVSQASMPLANARWVKQIHSSVPEKESLLKLDEYERQSDRVILPKFDARMLGDLVLTKTTDSEVLAIDFETGLTRWPFYHNSVPAKLKSLRFDNAADISNSELSSQLKSRVWGSTAYGRFSCDHERLYYIQDENDQVLDARRFNVASETNVLQGVSIVEEGKILWQVGGADLAGTSEPRLNGVYFLGPPLSFEGDLYAIVETNGETQLAVLDAKTGKLQWSQQLIHPVGQQLRFDPLRRSQALSPTIDEGIVLCPTGAGAIVAVDLLSRSLRWGATYLSQSTNSQEQLLRRGAFGGFGGMEFDPLNPRWQDSTLIAQDGMVIATPPESDILFARKILTGEQIVPPQRRNSGRYVAGARDGKIIIVGERQVYCLDAVARNYAWEAEYPNRAKLVGKGLWLADSVIVPLSGNRLLQINTQTGEVMDSATVDQPLGNLFAFRGNLISASATSVAAYYMRDELKSQVEQRLAQNAKEPWALNQSSQLAFAAGDFETAYALLSESYEVDPNNIDTRYLLIEVLLAGLEEDFAKFKSRAESFTSIVEYGPQRFRFLQWLASGSILEGDYLAAFDSLMELMRQRVGTTYSSSQTRAREMQLAEDYTVDTDNWIATELSRLYELADDNEKTAITEVVTAELAGGSGVAMPLRRQKLRYFAWHPSAANEVLSSAVDLLSRDDFRAAESLLIPLSHSASEKISEVATKLLARKHTFDNQNFGPYGKVFDTMYYSAPDADLGNYGAPESLDAQESGKAKWRAGQFTATEVVSERRLYPNGLRLPVVSERYGRPEIDVRLRGGSVVLANTNGEDVAHLDYDRASADIRGEFTRAIIRGGLLIIETSSEVIGMDMYRGIANGRDALLWRQSLLYPSASPVARFTEPNRNRSAESTPLGVTVPRRVVNGRKTEVGPLTPAGLVLQLATTVVCVDVSSGRQLWARDGYDSEIRFAVSGTQLAIVNPSMGEIEYLDCRDGQRLNKASYKGSWINWCSHGEWIVDYTTKQAKLSRGIQSDRTLLPVLKVWNPFTQETLAELDLPLGSVADIADGRYLVVADRNSKLHYFDLEQGTYREMAVPIGGQGTELCVERFGDVLVVGSAAERLGQSARVLNLAEMSTDFKALNGLVYGINVKTQELLWAQPGKLEGLFLPKTQPRGSPFMLTYRVDPTQLSRANQISGNRPLGNTLLMTLAVVDLRTGRLAYTARNVSTNSPAGFAMLVNPRSQTVEASIGGTHFVFEQTDAERAPQPVFHFGRVYEPETAREPPIRFQFPD